MMTDSDQQDPQASSQPQLTLKQFEEWHEEVRQQPLWRAQADREMDYRDGNQLDSEILRKQAAIGMPPAIEPLIGPVIDSVLGMEAQHRTDWRVLPDSDKDGDDVAAALSNKLNTAERKSKADKACSDAFAGQASVGIGCVEVSRESDPFKYPYRVGAVDRNEIFWDWRNKEKHGTDKMRYVIRRKWTDKEQAKLFFPDQADLIEQASSGWSSLDRFTDDGGKSTGLAMRGGEFSGSYGAVTTPLDGDPAGTSYPMLAASYNSERGSSIEEQEWRDTTRNRVCLFEVWYRIWVRALVMKTPDGRVVEYDPANDYHKIMVALGAIKPFYAVISKVRIAWWLGPHCLSDEPTPYRHNKFPYVFFWGKREDRTGVPFGLIRGMMYMQDNVNATTSKIRWGLSATRTIRTDGAALDDDETVRNEVSRPDADIVLDPVAMSKQGAIFKVERDFQLSEQQYKMLVDSRDGIKRTGGVTDAFQGNAGKNQSGVAVANIAEQSTQSLADLYDNFRVARMEVGELLMSLVIEDMIGQQQTVTIKGNGITQDRTIHLNVPRVHPETGVKYLDNDIERTLLKVDLEEVPHTPSFRAQQLASFSEIFKSAPPEYQRVLFPQLLALMDVPNKAETLAAVKQADDQLQASQAAEQQATADLKKQELDIKGRLVDGQVAKLAADGVKSGVEASYASMQAAEVIAAVPEVAPIADAVMAAAGYQEPIPSGQSPNFPGANGQPAPQLGIKPIWNRKTGTTFTPGQNTDPVLPAKPSSPQVGQMHGIETQRADGA
jgi:hypothetical protein